MNMNGLVYRETGRRSWLVHWTIFCAYLGINIYQLINLLQRDWTTNQSERRLYKWIVWSIASGRNSPFESNVWVIAIPLPIGASWGSDPVVSNPRRGLGIIHFIGILHLKTIHLGYPIYGNPNIRPGLSGTIGTQYGNHFESSISNHWIGVPLCSGCQAALPQHG